MEGSKLYELKKQLELAEIVVRLTNSHMWALYADKLSREAINTQEELKKAIKREEKK